MNSKFLKELTKLEDFEFFTMEHHFSIARMVRDTMSKNAIPEGKMASILGIPISKMKEVINGAYPFDLKLLAKLQAYNQEIASAKAKFKIEAESVGVTSYKDQYAVFIEKIEKILSKLENQTNGK